ncbi:MAG: hypothetical protein HY328_19010 [Chloroflexi bacterium]|nr:hypothetical protein [Chloroflexota bacterium]
MSEQPQIMDVFLDLFSNQPKNDQSREFFRQVLRQRFEDTLTDAVERVWDLPPILVKPHGEYLVLLLETRQLYLTGYFYSCVAMCGIVGERLIKDVFRTSVLIQKGGLAQLPSDTAFDQLERVEVNGIIRFLKEADLLGAEAAKAGDSLSQLRNQYAHARGKAPQSDALKAIKLLHTLVEDTVSVFKEFEIRDGVLVRKATP